MKDSGIPWVGKFPVDWRISKGKQVLLLKKNPVRDDDEVITCFRDGEVVLRSERRTDGFTMSDKEIGYQGIDKGDIVIHGMDGFAGAMGISKSKGKGSPVLIVCSPKSYDRPEYLISYLRVLAQTNVFLSLTTGIRERSCDLRWNKISELPFILPPANIQKNIVDFLDQKCASIDSLISLQEKMIEELKAYKQSIITEAVTKGLDKSAPMKDSGIEWVGEVPEHWEIVRLRFLCKIDTGNKDTINKEEDGIYPFYVRSPKIERINSYSFDGEAVLMSGDGAGAGRIFHYVNGKFDYHQRVYNMHEIKKIKPQLLYYYLSHNFWKKIEEGNAKSTVDSVRLPMLLDFPIVLGNDYEQTKVVDYLNNKCKEIDDLISIKLQKIDQLKEYKKSLIYEYVTGKKELPN